MPVNNPFRLDRDIDVWNKTVIAGAAADTAIKATPGVVHGIIINTAGNAASTITLYDGSVLTTAWAILSGAAQNAVVPIDALCGTSIHVKTVDAGGTLNITVLWR